MTQSVSICIVLDRSGSMENCRTDAVGAVNSYIRQVKADEEMDAMASVVIFDSQSIDTIRDRVKAANCPELMEDEYEPRAMTPLLDAVGHGAGLLDDSGAKDARKILVIMTDGLENASSEHTPESIAALLKRRQEEDGWLVVYLGADHDSWAQSRALGVHASASAGFSKRRMAAAGDVLYAVSARYSKSPGPRPARSEGFSEEERQKIKQ